ncbi:hypothetical protein ABZV31_12440 [Streptomyces sp. NPDC005202]|uniref:hypothetical protein n=1 Tax=Streptomyces sp. NPDC005202 TaxID=3157021 RepID=UPI0033A9DE90
MTADSTSRPLCPMRRMTVPEPGPPRPVGLFWITEDSAYVGAEPVGAACGVRLTGGGVEVPGTDRGTFPGSHGAVTTPPRLFSEAGGPTSPPSWRVPGGVLPRGFPRSVA